MKMNVAFVRGHQRSMINRTLVLAVMLVGAVVAAQPVEPTQAAKKLSPFDRTFGISSYATGWHGAYGGVGVGGRLRYEAFPFLGLDLFGEALLVPVPHGLRHDHPVGFNLYVPFRVGQVVRLRPLLGMCVTPSFFRWVAPLRLAREARAWGAGRRADRRGHANHDRRAGSRGVTGSDLVASCGSEW